VAENVAGLFSADDGLALARCIRELLDCGACETGWRLLDSQYFGVAQRRKRVFIVSDFGGESVDEILAITESLPGHPPPSREAGKGTAGDASESVGEGIQDVMNTLCSADCKGPNNQYVNNNKLIVEQKETYCLQGGGETSQSSQGSGVNKDVADQSPHVVTSQQGGEGVGVAFTASDRSNKAAWEGDISGTINCQMNSESSNLQMGVRENLTVRRLTPIECERLQGFPDNWTSEKMELTLEGNEWKATGKVVKQADGPRYKQMGNAITVNVGAWIGKQIGKVLDK
jgi:DNA (cytosine-5)-methyltransferase 1